MFCTEFGPDKSRTVVPRLPTNSNSRRKMESSDIVGVSISQQGGMPLGLGGVRWVSGGTWGRSELWGLALVGSLVTKGAKLLSLVSERLMVGPFGASRVLSEEKHRIIPSTEEEYEIQGNMDLPHHGSDSTTRDC